MAHHGSPAAGHIRDAACGAAVIPVSPLHDEHFVKFRMVSDGSHMMGAFGVMDAAVPLVADELSYHGGRAWGVNLRDGGWCSCSNCWCFPEHGGRLLQVPRAGDMVVFRIDCRTRVLSAAIDYLCSDGISFIFSQPVYHGDGRLAERGERFTELPVRLPNDVTSLSPWAVSGNIGDSFELVSVRASPRTPWSPARHALLPPLARSHAVEVACMGYHIAARLLPPEVQGAFTQLWMSHVLPDAVEDFVDRVLPTT